MKAHTPYSPLYFLASLGMGGLSVTFFMYLMFFTTHDTPIPNFNTLSPYLSDGNMLYLVTIGLGVLGILFFAFQHFRLLFWNLGELQKFKKSTEYISLKKTNGEVSLMAIPLTLAMSINVAFILGAVFVPNLWSIVEYLFPFALIAFLLVGVLALKIFSDYFTRIIHSGLDFDNNNNFSQMIAVFAFAMIGVGFAASTAMSHEQTTIILGMIGSLFFVTLTVFFGIIKFVLGFKSMLKRGMHIEASPTFWVIIPILTLLGISYVRLQHGIHTGLEMHTEPGSLFIITTVFFTLQLIFGYLGYKLMRENHYFRDYLRGDKKSPGSYALICPGVALVVFAFFFIHVGLVKNEIIDKFSLIYFLLLIPILYLQIKTILTVFTLNKKLLS